MTDEKLDLFASLLEPPPERKPREPKRKSWRPKLGPIGQEVLKINSVEGNPSEAMVKLLYGERGSLKSGVSLHNVALHLYDHLLKPTHGKPHITPLAVICTIVRSAATEGGAWEKLFNLTLPEWFDGIGLEFTEPKQDDQKNRYAFVGNKFGTWSRVILKSIPHGENIKARIKGMEPSMFLFEEITETDSADYLNAPLQQLRRPTGSHRIYMANCNPADTGEEHWVWKTMVDDGADKERKIEIPKGGGRLKGTDPKFGVWHIPLTENVFWSAEEKKSYQNTLLVEAKGDPTAEDRLIRGIWTAKATGEGLFKQYFAHPIHVKGDAKKGEGLLPRAGYPIDISYDLGQVNSCATFMQLIPTAKKPIWIVIDEVDHLRERILYKLMAAEIIGKMRKWCQTPLPSNKGNPYQFSFRHTTDESALNQWRPNEGSYDAWDFEREFNKVSDEFGLGSVKMMGCPKGDGSIESRVRFLQSKLYEEQFFVSATCPNTIDMLRHLTEDPKKPGHPKRSRWIHKFDSATYGPFRMEFSGDTRNHLPTGAVAPTLTAIG